MKICLYVVIESIDETRVKEIQDDLMNLSKSFSFSPSRIQTSLQDCLEFYATAELSESEFQTIFHQLNNDWDGENDFFEAYGFNTKMFSEDVYYLQFRIVGE